MHMRDRVPAYSPTGPDDAPLSEAIRLPGKRGFAVGQAVRDDHGDSRPGSTLESSRARVADGVMYKLAGAVVTSRLPNVAAFLRRGSSFYNRAGAERESTTHNAPAAVSE